MCAFAAFAGGDSFQLGNVRFPKPLPFALLTLPARLADRSSLSGEPGAADGAELRRSYVAVAVAGRVVGDGDLDQGDRDPMDELVVMLNKRGAISASSLASVGAVSPTKSMMPRFTVKCDSVEESRPASCRLRPRRTTFGRAGPL